MRVPRNFRPLMPMIVLVAMTMARVTKGSNENDHLNPVRSDLEVGYQQLLSKFLFTTPDNFARIVRLPSAALDGESAISFYSKSSVGDVCGVTYIKADKNIWCAASELSRSFAKRPIIRITRRDASIPRSTAELIATAIQRAVSRRAPVVKTGHIPIDGTEILFSTRTRKGKELTAMLDPIAEGKTSYALRRLEDLLRKYCEAEPTAREGLRRDIETEAGRLL